MINNQKNILNKNNDIQFNEQLLNFYFEQAIDGVFFMMLDEPLEWNDNIDKEAALDYLFTNQRITKINDAMLEQYKAKREEFIGLTPKDFLGHDLEKDKEHFRNLLENGKLRVDTQEKRIDGTDIIIEGDYICIYDKDNKVLGHFGVQRDVTLLREAEAHIKASEEKYRYIVENIYDMVYQLDLSGVFIFMSKSFTKLMGYELDEIIGHNFMQFIHPDDLQICIDAIQSSIIKQEIVVDVVYRIKHKDGTWRWHESKGTSVIGEQGNVLYLNGIARDITKNKEIDEEIKKHYANLLAVIDNTDDIICLRDTNHKVTIFNETFNKICKELFGIEAYVGLNTIEGLPKDSKENLLKILDDVLQGNNHRSQFSWDYGNGDLRYYDISYTPILKENTIIGYSEINRDITSYKKIELKLKEQNQILIDNETKLIKTNKILDTINYLQNTLLADTFSDLIFEQALSRFLELTESEYGFIGEIIDSNSNAPFLKTKAITNISWNDETKKFYEDNAPQGLEFRNLQTLFGEVIKTHKPMIANRPNSHPKRGGLPEGHPALNAFLGLPLIINNLMVGMIGVSNRPNGYDEKLITELEPLTSTIARLIETHNSKLQLKLAQKENTATKERMSSILNEVQDVIWSVKLPENELIFVSPSAVELYDLPIEEWYKDLSLWEKLVYKKDKHIINNVISSIQKNGESDFSYRIQLANKTIKWVSSRSKIIYDKDKNPIRLDGVISDITSKKHQENELELARNKAVQLSNYYRDLLENHSVYVVKIDLQGNYIFVNQHFESKLGFEGIIGTSSLKSILEEDRNICNETVMKCLNHPGEGFNVILRKISPKTNELVTNYWEFKAVKNEKNNLFEILCIGFEISELFKIQNELKETINSLEERNNSLQNFAHIVSHNLRSHSANISGLLSLISLDSPELIENQYYEFLNKATSNLMESIKHLSEVAQLHTNIKKDFYPINLNDSISNTLTNIYSLAENSGIKIINKIANNSTVIGEQSYIDSILLNFLTNAIKYRSTERDSFIRLTTYKENEYLVLVIQDNGLGIDLERHSNKLFGMFKTFHEHPEARGIGLFITNNQVKAIGGHIEVESQVNVGTTFKIYFRAGVSV